ncbi:MAG: M20/M25/M40 family metallo-hydrolase [Acidobacteriota bacterium]
MDIFQFTRELIEIESITGNEGAVGRYLRDYLADAGFETRLQAVGPDRFNVLASVGDPLLTFSSHIDTVPPFIASREDDGAIYGRGACDAKGVLAAQVFAARRLLEDGFSDIGLLYLVGEEDGSDGARAANVIPNRNRFLINGEPTESHQALATKGALRFVIEVTGKTAHAAYPECGESAIEKLIDILNDIRRTEWPTDATLGTTTYNIGTINGGRKANVVPDQAASELMFRTVDDPSLVFERVVELVGQRGEVKRGFTIPPVHLSVVDNLHLPTSVVRFGTDIPCLTAWGQPLLFGPGSIHDAHTTHEMILKDDLLRAIDSYALMARTLLATELV